MADKRLDILTLMVKSLPNTPGVYQFFDNNDSIIYIGKAKDLKKRVASYFAKKHESGKTRILVSHIVNIKHIVVDTEADALLLENNLIKKYLPKYNIMLKDDKSYPWVCIKKEHFPRIFSTRNFFRDGSTYFGPYTSMPMVKTMLDLVKKLYPLRNCNLNLTSESISVGKFKVCLEYHIGNCKGPCIGKQSEEEYEKNISDIKNILKGNITAVISYIKEVMVKFANEQRYEKAQEMKEKLEIIEAYKSKSTIVSPTINNVDVFSIAEDEKAAYVNFVKVVNGAIIQAQTLEMKKKLDEDIHELLPFAINEIRLRFFSTANEIIVPFMIDFEWPGIKFIVPQIGDKKKLLELSERNVKYYMLEKRKQLAATNPNWRTDRVLEVIKKDLHLKEEPVQIECFDNSNIQGTDAVASCVVFKNAKPAKKEYRKFNIKTVEGANDFASMEEIVYRRYKRLIEEEKPLPQLIVIDGGKGQLSAAVKSLEKLGLRGKIAIIGIAKKLEEIYFPEDPVPLYLDKTSETLRVIQQLRNEAHRFGINFHRDKRSKGMIQSEMDKVHGIGPKTKESLLVEFKSINKIREASEEELAAFIGKAKAKIVFDYFQLQKL